MGAYENIILTEDNFAMEDTVERCLSGYTGKAIVGTFAAGEKFLAYDGNVIICPETYDITGKLNSLGITSYNRVTVGSDGVIVTDEPTGNLDSKSGTEILKLFRNINKEYKKTIVQVTHSDDAASYGTSILRMKDGAIESKQEVKQLIG